MTQTETDHLDLLVTLHYVLAAVRGLFAMMPLLHIAMGLALVLGVDGMQPPTEGTAPVPVFPPPAFGWFFIIAGGFAVLIGLALATATVFAARCLKQRRNLLVCQIIAGVECMMFPFGTALGVFTLVTLSKPAVRALFDAEAGVAPTAA